MAGRRQRSAAFACRQARGSRQPHDIDVKRQFQGRRRTVVRFEPQGSAEAFGEHSRQEQPKAKSLPDGLRAEERLAGSTCGVRRKAFSLVVDGHGKHL